MAHQVTEISVSTNVLLGIYGAIYFEQSDKSKVPYLPSKF